MNCKKCENRQWGISRITRNEIEFCLETGLIIADMQDDECPVYLKNISSLPEQCQFCMCLDLDEFNIPYCDFHICSNYSLVEENEKKLEKET